MATYDDHLRLIGKRVVDFLLVLIELFSLGVTAEALRAIIGSQFTRVTDGQTDRQTDGQTEFSSLDRVCIPCSAVKNTKRKRKKTKKTPHMVHR